MFCSKCGNQISDDAAFCINCGTAVGKTTDGAAAQQNTEASVAPVQPSVPVQPSEPVQTAQATESVQYAQTEQQVIGGAAVAAAPKKKAPVALIIILSVVLLAGILVGCYFLFKAPLTRLFMGDEKYAESVIVGSFDKASGFIGLEKELNLLGSMSEMNFANSSADVSKTFAQSAEIIGASVLSSTKGKGISAEYSIGIKIDDENEFINMFGEEALESLKKFNIGDYSYKVEFAGNDSAYKAIIALLNNGEAEIEVQGYYAKNGDAYVSVPNLSDKNIKFSLPEWSIDLSESKENKSYQKIRSKFGEVLRKGEVVIEDGSEDVGDASFKGQIVEVTLDSELMIELFETIDEEISEFVNWGNSSPFSTIIKTLEDNDNFTLTFRAYVNGMGVVTGGSAGISGKTTGDKHTVAVNWIYDNKKFGAEIKLDNKKLVSAYGNGESVTEGVFELSVYPNTQSNQKFTLKVKYENLGTTTIFGNKTVTGDFEVSLKLDDELTEQIGSQISDILSNIKLKFSVKEENGGIVCTEAVQYGKVGSIELKEVVKEAGEIGPEPSSNIIDGSDSAELKKFADEISEKFMENSNSPLAESMLDYIKKSKVTSANSTAASLKNNIDVFLTKADTNGYGMKFGSNSRCVGSIKVKDGVWNVELSNAACFKNSSNLTWTETGTGSAKDSKADASSVTSLLAIDMASLFPEIENASIAFSLVGGACKAVAYTSDKSDGIVLGTDCPNISADGSWQNFSYFPWNGETDGITSDGLVVGTSPMCYMDESAVPFDEPGMNGESSGIEMPDFVGQNYNDVQNSYGDIFTFNVIEENSSKPEGTIIRQDYNPGIELEIGSVVTIYVSKGDQYWSAIGVPDNGKVLNIWSWNTEFMDRVTAYYPGYQHLGLVHGGGYYEHSVYEGRIGDIKVLWTIVPNDNNGYQNALDEALLSQSSTPVDENVDIFLVEPDYAKKYLDSQYVIPVSAVGITDADTAEMYSFTKQLGSDEYGNLKAVTWQACPGVFAYKRSIAKKVLGTDDPVEVQRFLSDWDKFNDTAARMKEYGYSMLSGYNDAYRVFANNITAPWVNSYDEIVIDSNILKWVEQTKEFTEKGYNNRHSIWTNEWMEDQSASGNVFGFFYSTWGVNFTLASNASDSFGDWAICCGPEPYFWGSSFICASNATDNASLVRDIMYQLACNGDVMEAIALENQDYANNMAAMDRIANNSIYGNDFLGGQNPFSVYSENAKKIDMSNFSIYDVGLNEAFTEAMKAYFEGRVSFDEALEEFYGKALVMYPMLRKP